MQPEGSVTLSNSITLSGSISVQVVVGQVAFAHITGEPTDNEALAEALDEKVDKVEGKGLSTNDYDNTEKQKVETAYTAAHSHTNKSVIDGITAEDVENWDDKQDELTPGDNITIDSNNKISATDTTYSAGTGIEIDEDNVISATGGSATWGAIDGTLSDQTDLNQALASKQATLTAGANITITNNTISATDTKYTAGEGIEITNNVIKNTRNSAEWGNIDGDIADQEDLQEALEEKVDKVTGKGLSTNDYDNTEKAKVSSALQPSALDNYYNKNQVDSKLDEKVDDVTLNGNSKVVDGVAVLTTVDNVTSTSTDPLSAKQGKLLNDRINNLESRGKFLALWNSITGLPHSEPTSYPYIYHTGDFFIISEVAAYTHTVVATGTTYAEQSFSVQFSFTNKVATAYTTFEELNTALLNAGHEGHSGTCSATGTCGGQTVYYVATDQGDGFLMQDSETSLIGAVNADAGTLTYTDTVTGSATNYMPNGTTYTGVASSTVTTESIASDDTWYFDGTSWNLQVNHAGTGLQDATIDDVSIVSGKVAVIPRASESQCGVVKPSTNRGIGINANGELLISAAGGTEITLKSSTYKPIVPATVDKAVMEGLGNNALTWSDAYKQAARNTIGAGTPLDVTFEGTSMVSDGVAAFVKMSDANFGLAKVNGSSYSIGITADGYLYLIKASDAKIEAKTNVYDPIVPANLDKAVMEGLGNNALTWSSAYQTSARNTIGAGVPINIRRVE